MKNKASSAVAAIEETPSESVNTTLGLIGGEVLLSLETCGPVSLGDVVSKLEWPSELVYMAVGSLIRRHMVGASFRGDEIVVHLFKRDDVRAEKAN